MYNNYPYQQQQPRNYFKGRPVGSLEEARVANIDFDGSLFIFPDIANKRIYTKTINADGTIQLCIYGQLQEPINPSSISYITKEELNAEIGELKKQIAQLKEKPINF